MGKKQEKIHVETIKSGDLQDTEQVDSSIPAGLIDPAIKQAQYVASITTGVTKSAEVMEKSINELREDSEVLRRMRQGINAMSNRPKKGTRGPATGIEVIKFIVERWHHYYDSGKIGKTEAAKLAQTDAQNRYVYFTGVNNQTVYREWVNKYPIDT